MQFFLQKNHVFWKGYTDGLLEYFLKEAILVVASPLLFAVVTDLLEFRFIELIFSGLPSVSLLLPPPPIFQVDEVIFRFCCVFFLYLWGVQSDGFTDCNACTPCIMCWMELRLDDLMLEQP